MFCAPHSSSDSVRSCNSSERPLTTCRIAIRVAWPSAISKHFAYRVAFRIGQTAMWLAIPSSLIKRTSGRWVGASYIIFSAASIAAGCLGNIVSATVRAGDTRAIAFAEFIIGTAEWQPLTWAFVSAEVTTLLSACVLALSSLLPLTRLPDVTRLTVRLTQGIAAATVLSHLAPLAYPFLLRRSSRGAEDAKLLQAVAWSVSWLMSGFGMVIVQYLRIAEREARQRAEEFSHAQLLAAESLADARAQVIRWGFHELRVPFNTLYLGLQELTAAEAAAQLPACTADTLSFMADAATAMRRILDDVLLMQKAEAGKLALVLEPTDVAVVARTAVRHAQPFARDRGLRLSVDLRPGLPALVLADQQRITQVLSNLLRCVRMPRDRVYVGGVHMSPQRVPIRTLRASCCAGVWSSILTAFALVCS